MCADFEEAPVCEHAPARVCRQFHAGYVVKEEGIMGNSWQAPHAGGEERARSRCLRLAHMDDSFDPDGFIQRIGEAASAEATDFVSPIEMGERNIAAEVLKGLHEVREHLAGKGILREAHVEAKPLPGL